MLNDPKPTRHALRSSYRLLQVEIRRSHSLSQHPSSLVEGSYMFVSSRSGDAGGSMQAQWAIRAAESVFLQSLYGKKSRLSVLCTCSVSQRFCVGPSESLLPQSLSSETSFLGHKALCPSSVSKRTLSVQRAVTSTCLLIRPARLTDSRSARFQTQKNKGNRFKMETNTCLFECIIRSGNRFLLRQLDLRVRACEKCFKFVGTVMKKRRSRRAASCECPFSETVHDKVFRH